MLDAYAYSMTSYVYSNFLIQSKLAYVLWSYFVKA